MSNPMTLRELLRDAIEHGHLDDPVTLETWTADGEYVEHVITNFRTWRGAENKPQQEIEIEPTKVRPPA